MTAKPHEAMEPPECDMADQPVICDHCFAQAEDECSLCAECQKESDAINGIQPNGTEETVKIALPKFKTTDGGPTCSLDPAHDHLSCPLIRTAPTGWSICGWTCHPLNREGGYLRPCENCPIHKSP
jgi:hypothetical protein